MAGVVQLCNFDNKPGMLCRGRCQHLWIEYIPMAAGFRCGICRTFQSDDLKRDSMDAFHDKHAQCSTVRPSSPDDAGAAREQTGRVV